MIRRYDMRRSDNAPLSASMSVTCLSDRMFIPIGFNVNSVIIINLSGVSAYFDEIGNKGFFIKFEDGYKKGSLSKFQYVVQ